MSHSQFSFKEIDSKESFSSLGQSLGGKSINNIIQLNPETGQGIIRKIDFERGLHARAWDLNLAGDFTLERLENEASTEGIAFSLVYILTTDSVQISSKGFRKPLKLRGNMNIILVPSNLAISFQARAGQPIKALDITISANWATHQFMEADPSLTSLVEKFKDNNRPLIHIESGSPTEYRTAADLHEHAIKNSIGRLYLKAKTLSLISDFLNRFYMHNSNEWHENGSLHQDKMLRVEKILDEHIEGPLPSIEAIAKQTALSESTLKRHFKLMFGKSIYEFYLEKKMDYAKRLLLEKPITVKEVAYRLGYEKTSNFIHIFKKFHSFSPGHLKKNVSF